MAPVLAYSLITLKEDMYRFSCHQARSQRGCSGASGRQAGMNAIEFRRACNKEFPYCLDYVLHQWLPGQSRNRAQDRRYASPRLDDRPGRKSIIDPIRR